MNRAILTDMLSEEYDIIEAEDGVEAVSLLRKRAMEISLVLLDIVMPKMDGFAVLAVMNQNHWIDDIPVIMISAESGSDQIERAYKLGVADFIMRPFDALIVHHRVVNTILLYTKQKKLIGMVADQIYEKERRSNLMIDILSHIVEFRNGESGLHVLRVRTLTKLLMKRLMEKTDRYPFSAFDITIICTASALHDIGKIAIDEKILNKRGKLTEEEFEIMKTHSLVGAEMLEALPIHQEEPLIKIAYEICRWHHERYDGRGYPDGLKGEDIPISAQIVSLADVYDALTSERVYKKAFSHDTSIQMILNGQCGAFNPILLECLKDISDHLEAELKSAMPGGEKQSEMWKMTKEMITSEALTVSEHSLSLLEHERMKYNFFAAMTEEIQFEYTVSPPMLTLSGWGAEKLGLDEVTMEPQHSKGIAEVLGIDAWNDISEKLRATTPENPITEGEYKLCCNGQSRWYRIVARSIWSNDSQPQYSGAIGKAVDIHDSRIKMEELEERASHDLLTGLFNHASAKEQIQKRMEQNPGGNFTLAICDLDKFKDANDCYGHIFGDKVLKHVAKKLRHNTRGSDIVARVGGDEFLIFLEDEPEVEAIIDKIFDSLTGEYEKFPISVSMGAVRSNAVGVEYSTLFHSADQALYFAKRSGRKKYCFYDESMKDMLSVISPIDSNEVKVSENKRERR